MARLYLAELAAFIGLSQSSTSPPSTAQKPAGEVVTAHSKSDIPKELAGASYYRDASRETDPEVFKALDKIVAFSKEKFSAYRQPEMPNIVITDQLTGQARFIPTLGKNGTIAISEEALHSSAASLLFTIGHEWGHDLVHANKNIGKLVKHDKRFNIKEHSDLMKEYSHELKDFVYSIKGLSKKEKKEIYETILDGQQREIFADRVSVLLTCDPEAAKKEYPPDSNTGPLKEVMANQLASLLVFDEAKYPPANGTEDTDAEFSARMKRVLETKFTHLFNEERVKYFNFPNQNVPPGCPVPLQNTPMEHPAYPAEKQR